MFVPKVPLFPLFYWFMHIDGSWRKNLGKYVQGLANQAVVYQMLKSLQMELDEATFRKTAARVRDLD